MSNRNLTLPVDHVSDTAYMVAAYRLLESRREDAHFHDELAVDLLGPSADTYLNQALPLRFGSWMMAVRTCIIDRWIEAKVAAGVDLVVNLAAGLDTRPYRLAGLPASLKWLEVDFAPVIEHKNTVLRDVKPRCHLERMVADLSQAADRKKLMDYIEANGREALVLTEGLIIYLEESTVRALAGDLQGSSCIKWWLNEFSSPRFLAWAVSQWDDPESHDSETSRGKVSFRFVPEDLEGFFRNQGWVIDEFNDFADASTRLDRLPPMAAGGTQADALKAVAGSGYAIMKKAALN